MKTFQEEKLFTEIESEVRCYGRSFPVLFNRAQGSCLFDQEGREYLDFLSGAGALNYGHNHPVLKEALAQYVQADGLVHGLDMYTQAKAEFLASFNDIILKPRALDYKVQFTGPTGANAVEAAIKLARKVTERTNIVAFTNGFHGVTLGALAATGNSHHRGGAGIPLQGVTRMPFDGYLPGLDTLALFEKMVVDASSGVDKPAAVLVETVQGEGGLNVAGFQWLKKLSGLCQRHQILLIVDDIQAGCGRTGTFFSFEPAAIKPDMVTLSKSLSGYGLPMAVLLLRPELDVWKPGEHNGTFRGNNMAFVTATAALENFWKNTRFERCIQERSQQMKQRLQSISNRFDDSEVIFKGRGLMCGLDFKQGEVAKNVARSAFEKGLVIETGGPDSEVLKCLCPLNIAPEELDHGLDIIDQSVTQVLDTPSRGDNERIKS